MATAASNPYLASNSIPHLISLDRALGVQRLVACSRESGAVTSVSGGYRGDPRSRWCRATSCKEPWQASNGGHMLSHAHQWVTSLPHVAAAAAAAAAALRAGSHWVLQPSWHAGSPTATRREEHFNREDLPLSPALHHRASHLGARPVAPNRMGWHHSLPHPHHHRRTAAVPAVSNLFPARWLHSQRDAEPSREFSPPGADARRLARNGSPSVTNPNHHQHSTPSPPHHQPPTRESQPRLASDEDNADLRRPGSSLQTV